MEEMRGYVSGAVRQTLRLEGLCVLIASCVVYQHVQHSWMWFFILFLAPDVSFAGYLAGAKAGAITYDVMHTYAMPFGLGIAFYFLKVEQAMPYLLIWTAHIGFDRALGYGLKYATGFGDTSLGKLGKK
jgi:Domain of unknown function (DUF4260)